jgi:hypothetical protein
VPQRKRTNFITKIVNDLKRKSKGRRGNFS